MSLPRKFAEEIVALVENRMGLITPEIGGIFVAMLAQAGVSITSLFGNTTTIALCIAGSVCGAFVKTAVFPPTRSTQERKLRQLSAEFAASMFCGVCLAPLIIEYSGMAFSDSLIIGMSFLVSLFGIGVIHKIAPAIERFAERRFQQKLDSDILKRAQQNIKDKPSIFDSDKHPPQPPSC